MARRCVKRTVNSPKWSVLTSAMVMVALVFSRPVHALLKDNAQLQHIMGALDHGHRNAAPKASDILPLMHLLMKPLYTETSSRPEPSAIHVTMNLTSSSRRFTIGRPLLTLPLEVSRVPTARYDKDSNPITAYDTQGHLLRLSYKDVDPKTGPRLWYLDEEGTGTDSEIIVTFTAPYRVTDETTPAGARIELRRDVSGGGLVGQGIGFLPLPPPDVDDDDDNSSTLATEGDEGWREPWNVTLEWDLGDSPSGIHGAWSLGDGQVVNAIGSLDRLIYHGIFAVGYLQRYPDWTSDVSKDPDSDNIYAVYWLDPSPYNMTLLAQQTQAMYARIATYFANSPDPFRVFLRRVEAGSGGTGATFSFLLEYSNHSAEYSSPLSMADLLAHETVHEFALLDLDPPSTNRKTAYQEDEGAWYVEGVASWVGDLVGLNGADSESRKGMIASLNNNAQAYYTAPQWTLNMSYGEVLERYWDDVQITRISYYRGFMFLAELDELIWKATNGKNSTDDMIVELYKLRRDGKPCTLDDLKDTVAKLIGREAMDEAYAAFFRGDLIVPSEDCLARHGLRLVKKNWHRFELGFDSRSLRQFEVADLVPGSNAQKAGVQEGDVIVQGYMVWTVQDNLDGKMKLTVLRDGQKLDIEWWPRSEEVVEAYGWIDIESEAVADEL